MTALPKRHFVEQHKVIENESKQCQQYNLNEYRKVVSLVCGLNSQHGI